MAYIGPEYFSCKHENLTITTFSKNKYKCDECHKEFILIPAKNDITTLPIRIPKTGRRLSPNPEHIISNLTTNHHY